MTSLKKSSLATTYLDLSLGLLLHDVDWVSITSLVYYMKAPLVIKIHVLVHFSGSHDGKVLFCLGISIGIISSFIANRREVEKLKDLLKQTENLVQDLQEELEMKDSLTVKELTNENNESFATCDNSIGASMANPFPPVQNTHNLPQHDDQELSDKKTEESTESMSKIEAELEAELERMGLNMNSSSLERRLSDFVEVSFLLILEMDKLVSRWIAKIIS